MRFVYFTQSLLSCWNHGNAHFLRGVLRDLAARGHDVRSFEPADGWSRRNLLGEPEGAKTQARFGEEFPDLSSVVHTHQPDIDAMLDGADVVLMHEWNDPALVAAVGQRRRQGGRFLLLFHDTHHRGVTDPEAIGALDLAGYDGVLAFGATLADVYFRNGWGRRAFVWHEAADTRLFRPPVHPGPRAGMVWIGNWGDDERSEELVRYLLEPAQRLSLPLDIHGVRYPKTALARLSSTGASYRGWLPNAQAPSVFARYLMTVHVPRRAYATQLPGIPTIRMFEALACGIPLISAPWNDCEALFRIDTDYLSASSPEVMLSHMAALRDDPALRDSLVRNGMETILARHTCAHRVDELLAVVARLRGSETEAAA